MVMIDPGSTVTSIMSWLEHHQVATVLQGQWQWAAAKLQMPPNVSAHCAERIALSRVQSLLEMFKLRGPRRACCIQNEVIYLTVLSDTNYLETMVMLHLLL